MDPLRSHHYVGAVPNPSATAFRAIYRGLFSPLRPSRPAYGYLGRPRAIAHLPGPLAPTSIVSAASDIFIASYAVFPPFDIL